MHVHFVGFRGEEWWSAIKAFGRPDFIHMGWDRRARREIEDGDMIVFANGADEHGLAKHNYPDIKE